MIAGGAFGAVVDKDVLGCIISERGVDCRSFLGYVTLGGAAGAIAGFLFPR